MAPVAGWTRFRTAQEWLDRNTPMASAAVPAAAPGGRPTTQDDTALYREFLEWRANRRGQPTLR
jgi:branched-chain amino acid transport system substrate-binding protein